MATHQVKVLQPLSQPAQASRNAEVAVGQTP